MPAFCTFLWSVFEFLYPGLSDGLRALFNKEPVTKEPELEEEEDAEMRKGKSRVARMAIAIQWTAMGYEIFGNLGEAVIGNKLSMHGLTEIIVATVCLSTIGPLCSPLAIAPVVLYWSFYYPHLRSILSCALFVVSSASLAETSSSPVSVLSGALSCATFKAITMLILVVSPYLPPKTTSEDCVCPGTTLSTTEKTLTKETQGLHALEYANIILVFACQLFIVFLICNNYSSMKNVYCRYYKKLLLRFKKMFMAPSPLEDNERGSLLSGQSSAAHLAASGGHLAQHPTLSSQSLPPYGNNAESSSEHVHFFGGPHAQRRSTIPCDSKGLHTTIDMGARQRK